MESSPLDFILNLDRHLGNLTEAFPFWIYAILFLVIFAETGLIFMAVLPGDSLLFASGALAAAGGGLDIKVLLPMLVAAAFAGDQANYLIGRVVGEAPFKENSRLFKRKHLDRAKRFYAERGGQAVILGRFIPVLRSVVPLTASVSGMPYRRFVAYSLAGSSLFAGLFLLLGYFVGNIPAVKENFPLVLGGVILLSLMPGLFEFLSERSRGRSRDGKHGFPAGSRG